MTKSRDEIAKEVGAVVIGTPLNVESIDHFFRTTEFFGLSYDTTWISGEVVATDGERFAFCRGYEKASTNLMLSQKLNENDLSQKSEKLYKRLYMGPMSFDMAEGKEMVELKSYPSKNSFFINIELDRMHWREENGEIDLHYRPLKPAFHWVSPGAKTKEELYYFAQMNEINGKVQGKEVKGYGTIETAWLPPGIGWTQCKTYKYLQDYWIVFANRYADGTIEWGISQYGAGNWNCGFFVDNGKPYVSTDNEFNMKWSDVGYPLEGNLRMGPHKFKWVVKSRMFEIKGNVIWATGQMINLAKKESPTHRYSWIEFRNHQSSFDPRKTKG
jgi:hypothetical protein